MIVPVRDQQREINASDIEHIGALVAGGLVLVSGIRRGDIVGFAMKVAGLGLIYRGKTGYRKLYDALGLKLPSTPTGVGRINEGVRAEVTIARPRSELYRIWRNLENLPVFMNHLLSVHEIDDTRSLWVAKAPAGTVIKWEAEIINDVPEELIAWQSLQGSGVNNAGSVHFEDAGEGKTRLRVVLRYDPPADQIGIWIAKVFQNDPQKQIEADLEDFRRIMEIGERKPITQESSPSPSARAL